MVSLEFIAYYTYSDPCVTLIIVVLISVLLIVILKVLGDRQTHHASHSATAPSQPPLTSPPSYPPPSRPIRQPPSSRPPPRHQGGYDYSPEPTFEGLNVEEWIKIARRAETDDRPEVVQKATIIIRKLRAMEETQPVAPPEAGRAAAEIAREKFRIAASQYNIGLYAEAAENLRIAVNKDPTHSSAWHLLGLTLRAQHEDVGAEQAFRNSLKRDPRNPDVLLSLAELLADSGRARHARDAANHAIDVAPRAWEGRKRVDLLIDQLDAKQKVPATAAAPVQKTVKSQVAPAVEPVDVMENPSPPELSPAPWEITDTPPMGTPASIASDAGWDQDGPGKLAAEASSVPHPTPPAPSSKIKICPFCANIVQGGTCTRCGAKTCRHCGEMNFATAHSCVKCFKDF